MDSVNVLSAPTASSSIQIVRLALIARIRQKLMNVVNVCQVKDVKMFGKAIEHLGGEGVNTRKRL